MTDNRLHPIDNDFISNLYMYNYDNSNNNIYYHLYNSIKKNNLKSHINLLINIINNKVDNKVCIYLFNNCIKLFKYNNFYKFNDEYKLITNNSIINFASNNNLFYSKIDNFSLNFYEIILYACFNFQLNFPSILLINNISSNYLHDITINEYLINIDMNKLLFSIYHVCYNTNYNIDYYLLYIKLMKIVCNNLTMNMTGYRILMKNIKIIFRWIKNILYKWTNNTNDNNVIDLDDNMYLEYQNDIIEFILMDTLKLIILDDYIDCISIISNNLDKFINEKSVLNIYSKCKFISLTTLNNKWYNENNIKELIKFFILLQKYNNSSGFDMRETTQFYISQIIIGGLTININLLEINDNILLYKFSILLINFYNHNLELINNSNNNSKIEYYLITMISIINILHYLMNILDHKWLDYIIYDIALLYVSTINIFGKDTILDMLYDDDILVAVTNNNIKIFLHSLLTLYNFVYGTFDKFKTYMIGRINIENINKFLESIEEYNFEYYYVFKNRLLEINDTSNNNIGYDIEFLDPLVYEIIENPVVIPDINIIMDDKIISKYLVLRESNPFNRNILKLEELIEYQEKEEIKEIVNRWKIKFNSL
jgi:hypothetical protein